MSKYDDLFAKTAPTESVFADKSARDPLAEPDEIIAREEQERTLARILNGVTEGYVNDLDPWSTGHREDVDDPSGVSAIRSTD